MSYVVEFTVSTSLRQTRSMVTASWIKGKAVGCKRCRAFTMNCCAPQNTSFKLSWILRGLFSVESKSPKSPHVTHSGKLLKGDRVY